MSPPSALESIFFTALAKPSDDERARYLSTACAGDLLMRRRVEKMLRAQIEASTFLEQPAILTRELLEPMPATDQPGNLIGPYELLEPIGQGGMGTVWLAQQATPVRRKVALKLIRAGMDSNQFVTRFEAERRTLALMDHPNIARVLDAGTTDSGLPYFAMELVEGRPITQYCDEQQLSPRQRLELFVYVCQAVQHAHRRGIIHRDVKPTNVLVATVDGRPVPKIIDFGVAKAIAQEPGEAVRATQHGVIIGTLEYMSPEQAELGTIQVDTRSDVYSLGAVLYELLCGSTPFTCERFAAVPFSESLRILREELPQHTGTRIEMSGATVDAISRHRNIEPSKLTRILRGDLGWIVMKALEKDRERRYESASALADDLQRHMADEPVSACPPSATYRLRKFVARHRRAAGLVAGLGLLTTIAAWQFQDWRDATRRARLDADHSRRVADAHAKIPQVEEAIRQGRHVDAFDLLQSIQPLLRYDVRLTALSEQCSDSWSVTTNPPGADVWVRSYERLDEPWRHVIRSSDHAIAVRLARGDYLWRATLPGYGEVIGLRAPGAVRFTLNPLAAQPAEMVRVDAGRPGQPGMAFTITLEPLELPAFLIDRHEVTNAEFERFVRSGGYDQPEFWSDLPFVDLQGNATTWDAIRPQLIDRSNRAGPATWREGTYPRGESDHPVRGLSWYEATAYARFVGKQLPTIYHWILAARVTQSLALGGNAYLTRCNFGPEVRSVAELQDWSVNGVVGMAGNVREWCYNANGHNARFVLGGACGDPIYIPLTLDSAAPLQRSELSGFRCMRALPNQEMPVAASASVSSNPWPPAPRRHDLMDAGTFDLVVRDRFIYDRVAPLDVVEFSVDEGNWTHVTALVNAAYKHADGSPERLPLHLYLPKHAAQSTNHQVVVYSPGGDARMLPRRRALQEEYGLDALVRSGRAVLCPVFQGSYERRLPPPRDAKAAEDLRLCVGLDLLRAVDYLQHRGDIDMNRLGYYGFSLGAEWAGSLVALESRFAAIVFEAAGLPPTPLRQQHQFLEWRHCLPRIQAPVLMINGAVDPIYPVRQSQQPMLELIGSPIKEHYVHPGGHHMLPPAVKFAQMLRWFDRHLGAPF